MCMTWLNERSVSWSASSRNHCKRIKTCRMWSNQTIESEISWWTWSKRCGRSRSNPWCSLQSSRKAMRSALMSQCQSAGFQISLCISRRCESWATTKLGKYTSAFVFCKVKPPTALKAAITKRFLVDRAVLALIIKMRSLIISHPQRIKSRISWKSELSRRNLR